MNETPLAFEPALAELEKVLRDLEDGTTTLDESLAKYERGVALLRQCYGHLQAAELKIQQLTGVDESGKPVLAPFAHSSSVTKSEPAKRRMKKEDAE